MGSSTTAAAQRYAELLTTLRTLPASENPLLMAADVLSFETTLPALPDWLVIYLIILTTLFAFQLAFFLFGFAWICSKQQFWVYRVSSGIWVGNTRLFVCITGILATVCTIASALDQIIIARGHVSYKYTILLDGLKWAPLWISVWLYVWGVICNLELVRIRREKRRRKRRATAQEWSIDGMHVPLKFHIINIATLTVPTVVPIVQTGVLIGADRSFNHGIDLSETLVPQLRQAAAGWDSSTSLTGYLPMLQPAEDIYAYVLYGALLRRVNFIMWAAFIACLALGVSRSYFKYLSILYRLALHPVHRPSPQGEPLQGPVHAEYAYGIGPGSIYSRRSSITDAPDEKDVAPSSAGSTEFAGSEDVLVRPPPQALLISEHISPSPRPATCFAPPRVYKPQRSAKKASPRPRSAAVGSWLVFTLSAGAYPATLSFLGLAIWGAATSIHDKTLWMACYLHGCTVIFICFCFLGTIFVYRPAANAFLNWMRHRQEVSSQKREDEDRRPIAGRIPTRPASNTSDVHAGRLTTLRRLSVESGTPDPPSLLSARAITRPEASCGRTEKGRRYDGIM